MRISNSFSEGEVQVLEFILQTLLRGGTPSMATRNKDFASLYRKVITMKTRMEKKKKGKDEDVSSVGLIEGVVAPEEVEEDDDDDMGQVG
ncbi:MAG: hypothetical protein ACI9KE_006406 [Polyangiales bacterium]|jgi:hypothetical protein